ncbi:MAG TPA: hypothetical protein VKU38_08815 [Ktedonobacteraceae bacterium]|nr:hypothetical protein [Ktedonobacteraceae bacterium]
MSLAWAIRYFLARPDRASTRKASATSAHFVTRSAQEPGRDQDRVRLVP